MFIYFNININIYTNFNILTLIDHIAHIIEY